ncbi:50S ribosomal protein L4 [bacterium]|nr:50S ribosomal protein L4 [bacterium]
MPKVDMKSQQGQAAGSLELRDDLFGAPVREHLLWEVVRNQLANRRAGTKKTKGRTEVSYSGAKLYRQKGTGRARAGSARSGVRVGGGHIHAIEPKDWSFKTPKKVRRGALVSALSMKAGEDKLTVVDALALDAAKTKSFVRLMGDLGVTNALFVVAERDESLERASRNLGGAKVLPVAGLNVYDILRYDRLVVTKDAVAKIEERLGQ